MANLRKELKKYLSTQELGDRLTKLNRNKKRHKRKLATSEDINDMDPLTPINPLDRLPQEKQIKGCVYIVKNNTGVTNAMNILTCKAENLKQKVSASFV